MTDPATERWEGRGRWHTCRKKACPYGTPGKPLRYRGTPPCGGKGDNVGLWIAGVLLFPVVLWFVLLDLAWQGCGWARRRWRMRTVRAEDSGRVHECRSPSCPYGRPGEHFRYRGRAPCREGRPRLTCEQRSRKRLRLKALRWLALLAFLSGLVVPVVLEWAKLRNRFGR